MGGFGNLSQRDFLLKMILHILQRRPKPLQPARLLHCIHAVDQVIQGYADPQADILLTLQGNNLVYVSGGFLQKKIGVCPCFGGGSTENPQQLRQTHLQDIQLAGVAKKNAAQNGIEDFASPRFVSHFHLGNQLTFTLKRISFLQTGDFPLLDDFADLRLLRRLQPPPFDDACVQSGCFINKDK